LQLYQNHSKREINVNNIRLLIPRSAKHLRSPLLCLNAHEQFIKETISSLTAKEDKLWVIILVYLVARLSTFHNIGLPSPNENSVQSFIKSMQQTMQKGISFFGNDWQSYNQKDLEQVLQDFYPLPARQHLLKKMQRCSSLSEVASILKQQLPSVSISASAKQLNFFKVAKFRAMKITNGLWRHQLLPNITSIEEKDVLYGDGSQAALKYIFSRVSTSDLLQLHRQAPSLEEIEQLTVPDVENALCEFYKLLKALSVITTKK
jgi:hypothetical protein